MPVKSKMKGDGRIYAYRASLPTKNLEIVQEQLYLVHKYRNRLVELELNRRSQVDQALRDLVPDLEPTELALKQLDDQIAAAKDAQKKANIKQRGRKVAKSDRDALKDLKAQRKVLYQKRKQLRKDTFSSTAWKSRQTQIENNAKVESKAARASCGLYWGSYAPVEEAARAFRRGAPPRFHRWTGEGKLAVQMQAQAGKPDFTPDTLTSCSSNLLRLELRPEGIWVDGKRRPKKLGNALLWFRVGSTTVKPKRQPIWAEVPIKLHRPLPSDCKIKWCYLQRRKRGTKTIWEVCFVLQGEHGAFDPGDQASEGHVGIDVGWRKYEDRLRIAVYSGSDGQEGELCLPDWWLGESRRVERIRGHRDKLLDAAKTELKAWIKGRESLPDWLTEAGKHMHQWRSASRLAGLCLRWRGELIKPTTDGAAALASLEAWRERDKHLYEYEAHLRAQLQGSRKDLYRKFAAMLSRKYATAYIEDLDLRKFHQLRAIEEGGDKGTDSIRAYVRDACLSELFDAIKSRFRHHVKVDPANTTKQCHACSVVDASWVDHAKVDHECSSCSVTWDQDTNAARNLLNSGDEPVTQFGGPALAPVLVHTYTHKGPNRARRRARRRRALEKKRLNDAA